MVIISKSLVPGTASQRHRTTGCGYNRAQSEEVEKERSEVECLCTGTAPPNTKMGG